MSFLVDYGSASPYVPRYRGGALRHLFLYQQDALNGWHKPRVSDRLVDGKPDGDGILGLLEVNLKIGRCRGAGVLRPNTLMGGPHPFGGTKVLSQQHPALGD